MGKSILLVVHGIGEHTADSIKKTVVDAANEALKRYSFMKEEKFEDHVEVIGVSYDDIFETERELIATNAKTLKEILKGTDFSSTLIDELERINEDKFLTTHALDVLFYAGLHCEQVRSRVLRSIAKTLEGDEEVHIMAHSMGTAVVQDTLHKAFTGGFDGIKDSNLDPHVHKINSLWMVANTSQVFFDWNPLGTNIDPQESMVNPSMNESGCVLKFFNLLHQYDLVGQARPFESPPNWEVFKDNPEDPQTHFYHHIGTEDFYTSKNPHDLGQYIEDPKVSNLFLKTMMPTVFNPSPQEEKEATLKIPSINEQAKDIIEYAKNGLKDVDDFKAFIKMIRDFKNKLDDLT
ncbi:hypothetical protein C9J12_27120 [Photobacterium frigidiphilum]|uniref:Alpha/beta hydrolase n=1 Tax=Photobacterium frigidiphilum TaxID=264736 RepID=A0A2T3J6W7_9GAMM|nr:alpha/beta hydrolase [Photobacterium frigidiphilum]PSU44489.1 hypothetical protein C9J12_27120 [Photobacterium frigidiphilum]